MWPFKRTPPVEWVHLGYVELSYIDEQKKPTSVHVVHFFADKDDLSRRRVEVLNRSLAEWHNYYQKYVVEWLKGGNLWKPIASPSDWFKAYTARETGHKHVDGKWIKPVPIECREGNVITLKTAK